MGLLRAEQNVGTLNTALSRILGLLCAEEDVGNLKKCNFRNLGTTPVRRTRRRKSQNINTFGHTFGTHLERMEHIAAHLRTLVGDN